MQSKRTSRATGLILCALVCFSPACRPEPVSPPPTSTVQPDLPENRTSAKPATDNGSANSATAERTPKTVARNFPESLIRIPNKDSVSRRLEYNTFVSTRSSEISRKSAWQYRATRAGEIVGFEFSNQGGNRILPPVRNASKNQFFTRDFQFHFDERARQDIYLMVSDWVPSRDRSFHLSNITHSLMLFFPRKVLPAIVNAGERDIVTLPTGETVEFDTATHEIRAGVLAETPVELSSEPNARKFPGIVYRGAGIVVRADARGKDPKIANLATITTGSPSADCDRGTVCNTCQVPSKELWDQSGAERFKFPSDAEFERFLMARCGFGVPTIAADGAFTTVQ